VVADNEQTKIVDIGNKFLHNVAFGCPLITDGTGSEVKELLFVFNFDDTSTLAGTGGFDDQGKFKLLGKALKIFKIMTVTGVGDGDPGQSELHQIGNFVDAVVKTNEVIVKDLGSGSAKVRQDGDNFFDTEDDASSDDEIDFGVS